MDNTVGIVAARDLFDYLAILAPLFFSAVAVIIAVCTATKQNKISLFDKRFEVYLLSIKLKVFFSKIFEMGYKENFHVDQIWRLIFWVETETIDSPFLKSKDAVMNYFDIEPPIDGEAKAQVVDELSKIVESEVLTLRKGEMLFKGHLSKDISNLADRYNEFMNSLFDEYFYANGRNDIDAIKVAYSNASRLNELVNDLQKSMRRQLRF